MRAWPFGRRSPEQYLYLPLTEDDERARRTRRYRVGRWMRGQGIAVALCALVGPPLAFVLDWLDGPEVEATTRASAILVALWLVAAVAVYCWWGYWLQDWSELGRAYRVTWPTADDDPEVVAAKQVLLERTTRFEREQAVAVLLGRGAIWRNEVSLAREVLGYVVAFVVVLVIFALLVGAVGRWRGKPRPYSVQAVASRRLRQ